MQSKSLIAVLLLPLLFGCLYNKTLLQYVAPEGAATANVRNLITGRPAGGGITIWGSEGTCQSKNIKIMFETSKVPSKESLDRYLPVSANRPVRLLYSQFDMTSNCDIALEVTFEAGKSYSLIGGPEYQKGSGIFDGKHLCSFGVMDDKARTLLPAKECP